MAKADKVSTLDGPPKSLGAQTENLNFPGMRCYLSRMDMGGRKKNEMITFNFSAPPLYPYQTRAKFLNPQVKPKI
jgi:hypothetical protein